MPDPDYKKRRGPGHPNLEITRRPGIQKKGCSRGGGGGGEGGWREGSGPSPRSATDTLYYFIKFLDFFPFNYVVHEKSQN